MGSRLRYAFNELAEHWADKEWWRGRITHRLNKPVHKRLPDDGHEVVDDEWDNLVILDACRADLFEEVADLDRYDSYSRKTSVASSTPGWVTHHFTGGEFPELVYVTGNPQVPKHAPGAFHHVENVWQTDQFDELGSVPPETVRKAALRTHADYPNKRLVIHFMQPHQPFLGVLPDLSKNPFHALRDGDLTKEEVWNGYRENLKRVLSSVETLLTELSGRTMVTSDHGNLLGERIYPIPVREYGHPPDIHHPALRTVPCGVVTGTRRKTTPGTLNESDTMTDEINNRLKQLGYKQ